MIAKRLFDIFFSGLGLLLLLPLFLIMAVLIKLDSKGPVFFRQERVGLNQRRFRIYKFRTMEVDAEKRGLQITVGADRRVTRVGLWLRKYKLDELAQLIDVFRGEMSLVGPRPEVPYYVEFYPEDAHKIVFSVRPGITDWASIKYKDENEVLAKSPDPRSTYINEVLPIKINFYLEYVRNRSFIEDIKIIFFTLKAIFK